MLKKRVMNKKIRNNSCIILINYISLSYYNIKYKSLVSVFFIKCI